ncbi:hypothetical protein CSKR_110745 [Clonorchis sinensis]|uniref:Uncharacterized protein n=1 Tax=Clonorchis sinensis TaxID=79923 RepID=A0A3R7EYT7_CLOSI|nr:hypothetical protein CSKR_110745 [Clonorchis sinensis]
MKMDSFINASMDIESPRDIEDPKSRVFFYMASDPSVSIREEQWDVTCGQDRKCSIKRGKLATVFVETPPLQRKFSSVVWKLLNGRTVILCVRWDIRLV